MLVTVNNRLIFQIEIIHDLLCHCIAVPQLTGCLTIASIYIKSNQNFSFPTQDFFSDFGNMFYKLLNFTSVFVKFTKLCSCIGDWVRT